MNVTEKWKKLKMECFQMFVVHGMLIKLNLSRFHFCILTLIQFNWHRVATTGTPQERQAIIIFQVQQI